MQDAVEDGGGHLGVWGVKGGLGELGGKGEGRKWGGGRGSWGRTRVPGWGRGGVSWGMVGGFLGGVGNWGVERGGGGGGYRRRRRCGGALLLWRGIGGRNWIDGEGVGVGGWDCGGGGFNGVCERGIKSLPRD